MKFKNISDEEKPREKALKYGFKRLSNVEIIALFLRTGSKKKSVLSLSQQLLEQISGIGGLINLKYKQIVQIKGIGRAKALGLLASFELVRRIKLIDINKVKFYITSPTDVYDIMEYDFDQVDFEHFYVLLLDNKNQLINKKQLYQGTQNQILIDLKDIFEFVLENRAKKMICVHNHPSGNSLPSKEDLETTKQIWEIAKKLNIVFIDHIIFGKNELYSIILNTKTELNKSKESTKNSS